MTASLTWRRLAAFVAALTAVCLTVACGGGGATGAPAATPVPTLPVGADAFAHVAGIVDPANHSFPRTVQGLNGRVTINARPQRIHTTSAGLDEITVALVPLSRIAAVGTVSQNPANTYIADTVKGLPGIARDPEQIAGVKPDLVVVSTTQKPDFLQALANVKITAVQLDLSQTPGGRIDTILLMGYMYGEEDRALKLANEVQLRYNALTGITLARPEAQKPLVLAATKYSTINVAGKGTTGEGITIAAGGRNAAAAVDGNANISIESIIAMNPDVIIIPMADDVGSAFKQELLANKALATVPAIRDSRVFVVTPQLHTTLSFSNVRAAEQLATLIYPNDKFPNPTFPPFSLATP